MGQDSYSTTLTVRRPGKPVDLQSELHSDIVTGRNELATAIMPGRFLTQGAAADDVMIDDTGATGGVYIGLAVDIDTRERATGYDYTSGYPQNALVPVARSGRWYVECASAAAKGGTVYVRFVAGTSGAVGTAYNTTDAVGGVGANEATCVAIKAKFAETISAAGTVAVELLIAQV
ncbi:hypothetical protein KKI24_27690 [bacterium]|nr:hypothetical protein [bacterium]